MRIPKQYHGHWSGIVTDFTLVNPYPGEIVLDEDSVNTHYSMSHGPQTGETCILGVADGFILVKEIAGSFRGTLLMYLDAHDNLKCVWRTGAKFNSEATLTRN